jgi:hypothetical protein
LVCRANLAELGQPIADRFFSRLLVIGGKGQHFEITHVTNHRIFVLRCGYASNEKTKDGDQYEPLANEKVLISRYKIGLIFQEFLRLANLLD